MFFPPPLAKLEIRKEEGKRFANKVKDLVKDTNKQLDTAVREEGKIVKKAFIDILRSYIDSKHKSKISSRNVRLKTRPVKSGKSRGVGRKGFVRLKSPVGWSWKSGPRAGQTGTPALIYWLLFGTKPKGKIKGVKSRDNYDIWKEVSDRVGTKARKKITDVFNNLKFK